MTEQKLSAEPDRVFGEPWHANVFALAVKLSEAGHFTWAEWTARFSANLKRAALVEKAADDHRPMPEVENQSYYDVWLDTLEALLIERGLATAADLGTLKEAWTEAYLRTPHGMPVELDAHDGHRNDHEHEHKRGHGHRHKHGHGHDH